MSSSTLDDLLAHVRSYPESRASLLELCDYFLMAATPAAERQQIRAALKDETLQMAYESLYFDGVGMEDPARFLRRMLAALSMTGGFTNRETAQQILGELRIFAAHHEVDFESCLDEIRALSGARRSRWRRLRFALLNGVLLLVLILGIVLIQSIESGARIVLQIGLLLAVMGAQLFLLYRQMR